MNELQIFRYEGSEIRTIERDGELWWVLKDVCTVFGEQNYRRVAANLDDDEKGVSQINTPGGPQSMTVVNESGVYTALFSMQPQKARGVTDEYIKERQEKLHDFTRWVTHEVLPSIRKTGSYSIEQRKPLSPAELLAAQANLLVEHERKLAEQQEQLAEIREQTENVTEKLHGIATAFSAPPSAEETWQEHANDAINELVEGHGLNHQGYRRYLYDVLERRARCDLHMRQCRMKKRMADAGKGVNEQKLATKLHIIAIDPKLRAIFDGILREEQAKYMCV